MWKEQKLQIKARTRMPSQHSIPIQSQAESKQLEGIVVPLDLPDLKIVKQEVQTDGSIEVHVRALTDREACPRCRNICVKVHDTRMRGKRDINLRNYQIRLVLYKRRFRCFACQRTFIEPDSICGRYKRTTKCFRDDLAKRTMHQPIAHVAQAAEVGPRFVQECFEFLLQEKFTEEGKGFDETSTLATPRFLGIDEFARRKGHRYDTILCDLDAHRVVEISEGRKLEDVQKLLERLSDPDKVEAVSMDMSASSRPAVQLCLPKAKIV